jgi:cephalosporin hydroxylase
MAFIDGDHAYDEVVKDIKGLEPFLVPGAWVCFDDAFTVYEGVDKAINEYILNNNNYKLGHQVTRKLFVAQYIGHNKVD